MGLVHELKFFFRGVATILLGQNRVLGRARRTRTKVYVWLTLLACVRTKVVVPADGDAADMLQETCLGWQLGVASLALPDNVFIVLLVDARKWWQATW